MNDINEQGAKTSLWERLVEEKGNWIGGTLVDSGDNMDRQMFGEEPMITMITDLSYEQEDDGSGYFSIHGADFDCGFNTRYGGIGGGGNANEIRFGGYGGHQFYIKKPDQGEKKDAKIDL